MFNNGYKGFEMAYYLKPMTFNSQVRLYLTESVSKSFCKSLSSLKSVNSFFMLVIIKDNLTDLCGN